MVAQRDTLKDNESCRQSGFVGEVRLFCAKNRIRLNPATHNGRLAAHGGITTREKETFMNTITGNRITPVVVLWLALISLLFNLVSPEYAHPQEQKAPCPKPYISSILPNAGKPGDQVRIRGRRFRLAVGTVTFSPGVEAEITNWQNSRIRVIVPESAQSGPVTVSVPCGSVSNEKHFTVKE